MDQIFVANPKGGCGKTTISTQLAGYYAGKGKNVLLIDHDAQKSSSDWLGSRPYSLPTIHSIAASVGDFVVVNNAEVVVHDMPAAWSLDQVSEIIHQDDKVLIPVLSSPNDIKACLRFMMDLNRSGILETGVSVGFVVNRFRTNIKYAKVLEAFLERVEMPLIGEIRDTQNYVRAMDRGLSIFDLPPSRVKQDVRMWQPIFDWLNIE